MSRFQDRRNQQKRGKDNEYISKNVKLYDIEQSILHMIFCEVYGAQDAFSIAVEKVPVQMSTVFPNLVVLAWLALQLNQRLASLVLEPLEANFLQEVRCLKARQVMVRPTEKRSKTFPTSEKKKKRTQFHYFCTAVLGKQRDSKMEHFLHTHTHCAAQHSPNSQLTWRAAHSEQLRRTSPFIPVSPEALPNPQPPPQLPVDPLSGLRHTPSTFRAKMWWAEEKLS